MNKLDFVLGLHCHQPVGNFPEVIEKAYQDAYLPFIDVLEQYPQVKAVLHYTGPLWEYFLREHTSFVARLRSLACSGRVELLGGGFYEPILTVIPPEDAVAQLNLMRECLQRHTGQSPHGVWLAERVWEPHLPSLLARCGVRYLALDDTHFHRAGVPGTALTGPYITEDQGHPVRVFPIDTTIRYLIPFKSVPQVIEHFRSQAHRGGHPLLTLVDDGEKFGIWPHTKAWVYEGGWLERFLHALSENSDWLRTITLREAYETREPRGRVYLPTTSYFELGQWALPWGAQHKVDELKELLGARAGEFEALISGGQWREFLAKYPEANYMHKRMLELSRAVRSIPNTSPLKGEAQRHILQTQSNDAYWHGLFGGVYLPHLRDAVWHHLLSCESLIEGEVRPVPVEEVDIDVDGHAEIVLRSPTWTAVLAPRRGGTLVELSHKGLPFNFLNTIARRPEGYHARVREAATETAGSAKSIHELAVAKQPGLEHFLLYDEHPRGALVEHLLSPAATWEDLAAGRPAHVAQLAGKPYTVDRPRPDKPRLRLWRREELPEGLLTISKSISLCGSSDALEAHWEVTNHHDCSTRLRLGAELNLALLAGDARDRYLDIPGRKLRDPKLASAGEELDVRNLRCVNEWDGWTLLLEVSPEATLWRYPVHTVNNSEAGFELVYQATCLVWVWEAEISPGGKWSGHLRMSVRRPS